MRFSRRSQEISSCARGDKSRCFWWDVETIHSQQVQMCSAITCSFPKTSNLSRHEVEHSYQRNLTYRWFADANNASSRFSLLSLSFFFNSYFKGIQKRRTRWRTSGRPSPANKNTSVKITVVTTDRPKHRNTREASGTKGEFHQTKSEWHKRKNKNPGKTEHDRKKHKVATKELE